MALASNFRLWLSKWEERTQDLEMMDWVLKTLVLKMLKLRANLLMKAAAKCKKDLVLG